MASQAERDADNGARPSTGGSAMRIVVEINDVWTARILVTAVSGAGISSGRGIGTFFRKDLKLVTDKLQPARKVWVKVKNTGPGSIIVDLDCGSHKKFYNFKKTSRMVKLKMQWRMS